MDKKHHRAMAAFLASSLSLSPLFAQVAGGTSSLNPKSDTELVSDVSQWNDNFSADRNQAIFKDLAKQFKDGAASDLSMANKLRLVIYSPNLSPQSREQAIKDLLTTQESQTKQLKSAALSEKVANVLKALNLFGTGVKAITYVTEGDYTGAKAVVINEFIKSVLAGSGAAAGTWIPGGQFVGASAGEYVHEKYVQKTIEDYENAVRNSEYADKYLGKPWLHPELIIDDKGNVRELPNNQYMNKWGNIITRTPDEQKAYEDSMHTGWLNEKKWLQVEKDFANGKINPEQYSQLRAQWKMHNPNVRWNPLGAGNCEDAANDSAVKEMLQIAQKINSMAQGIQAGVTMEGAAGDAAVLRSVGKANDMMAMATRLQTLNNQVVAKYTKECLQGIAVAAGLAPEPKKPASQQAEPSLGWGVVKNKDGSRDELVTGKDADGKPVKVWTTYNKEGRVTATRIER